MNHTLAIREKAELIYKRLNENSAELIDTYINIIEKVLLEIYCTEDVRATDTTVKQYINDLLEKHSTYFNGK